MILRTFLCLFVGFWSVAFAESPTGEVPVPFNLNQTVELAQGEDYQLKGRVLYSDGRYLFMVNLSEHRWLSSAKRRKRPFYEVIVHPELDLKLSQFENRFVMIKAKAEEVLRVDNLGNVYSDIRLVVLTPPESSSKKRGAGAPGKRLNQM